MKSPIQGRSGIYCMIFSILVLFAVSACATRGNMADLNLTYIGEATGPNESLTYFLQGPEQGEAVVLLPGMGRGAGEFRELAAALNKAGYRTIAVQPRGIGRSGPVLTNPSYEKFADDVELILQDVPGGISGQKVHVLGYELGNRIARMFAVRYPQRVQTLVLLACGGQDVSSSSSTTKASKTAQSDSGTPQSAPSGKKTSASTKKAPSAKDLAADPSAVTENIDSFFSGLAAKSSEADPQDVTLPGMIAAFVYWLPPSEREPFVKKAFFAPKSKVPFYWITGWYRDTGWMQQAMDMDHSSTSANWVSGGKAPMLILNGEDDVAAPMSNAIYMKKTYPDRVTLAKVPDAGHAMLAEQPKFIIDHVIPYLKQHRVAR